MAKKKLSIVVPCYNEEKNIPLILNRFLKVLGRADIEVILVNNGSTDDSENVLKELLPQYPFARSVRVEVNQGYGFGIIAGLNEAVGDYIGWTHADMQTDPNDVMRALAIIEEKGSPLNIFIKGDRRNRQLFDQVFTWGMSCFESMYLGKRLWDINAQPNIFSRSFYSTWKNPPHDFSLDLYALYMARRQDIEVVRFEVVFPKRIYGQSSWNTGLKSKGKFIKRTLDFSVSLKKRLKV